MGVDAHVLKFLLDTCSSPLGDGLMLGRQGVHIGAGDPALDAVLSTVSRAGDEVRSAITSGGYADQLLTALGCSSVRSLDISSFEGADITHDMNLPVPDALLSSFDFILDGGTLEHIFDFPQAINNVKKMLRPNGLFLFINAANNMLGHGLYQFSPELMWRLFDASAGYEVEAMRLVDTSQFLEWIDTPDPKKLGERNEISMTDGPTYLMMAARKQSGAGTFGSAPESSVFQSDYVPKWMDHNKPC